MKVILILKGFNRIRNLIKRTFLVSLLTVSATANARIHEFETTHLKSRAGAGVGGIFLEESAFLNPASLSFYQQGSFYFQRDTMTMKDDQGEIMNRPKNTAFGLFDGNGSGTGLSGGLTYLDQTAGTQKRKRWGFNSSAAFTKTSAFGVSVRKTTDKDSATNSKLDYYQTVFGITHAISPRTSLGIVAYDAFASKGKATKGIIGLQHIFVDYITLSFDLGANWKAEELGDTLLYRGAVQVRVWDDFFLRFGTFKDKELDEKGNGFGLSWIQPRLSLEFAIKNTKRPEKLATAQQAYKIKDTSFSVVYKF